MASPYTRAYIDVNFISALMFHRSLLRIQNVSPFLCQYRLKNWYSVAFLVSHGIDHTHRPMCERCVLVCLSFNSISILSLVNIHGIVKRCWYLTVDNHRVIEQRIWLFFWCWIDEVRQKISPIFFLSKRKGIFFSHLFIFMLFPVIRMHFFPVTFRYKSNTIGKYRRTITQLVCGFDEFWCFSYPKKMVSLSKTSLKMHRCHRLFIYWCWTQPRESSHDPRPKIQNHFIKILCFLFFLYFRFVHFYSFTKTHNLNWLVFS